MSKSAGKEVILPITNTGRKYGYIIWHKKRDKEIEALLGDKDSVSLQFEGALQIDKHIDWKKRRISITATVTRALPKSFKTVRLSRQGKKILVSFK